MENDSGYSFSIKSVTSFYIPLLLQAFSQSLTYPLVAGIVTHGPDGVHGLTAFAQGLMIMFFIGALGGGLMMTGMVFAKTRKGYEEFKRLNTAMMCCLLILQSVLVLPPFDKWIFEGLFALPAHLASTAKWTLLGGVVMNAIFFVRNLPVVVLFNNLQSSKANIATAVRIVFTLLCCHFLPRINLTGAFWGLFVLTFGCFLENLVMHCYAHKYIKALPGTAEGEHISLIEQFRFTLPLSFGGFLLMSSPLFVAAFVGKSENPQDMLAIHYVTIGLANPIAYAALRMQAVAIEFPPKDENDRNLIWYSVCVGVLLGLIPMAFTTDFLANWYFGEFQNLPANLIPTAKTAIGLYSVIAIIQALRARVEGVAAVKRKPKAVMCGQISYVLSLFFSLFVTGQFSVPGWAMAVISISIAPMVTGIVVSFFMRRF
jgi:hypothetical protein